MRVCLIALAGTLLVASLVAAPQNTRVATTTASTASTPTPHLRTGEALGPGNQDRDRES